MMNVRLPSMRSLQTLIAVAQTGSFSEAAKVLHVSQSTVSKQIQRLEEGIGKPLFERHAGGVRLNRVGEPYLNMISASVNDIANATAQARQQSARQESVSLLVPPSFASLWLIPQLPAFKSQYPDISVVVSASDYVPQGKESEMDILIRCQPHQQAGAQGVCLIHEHLSLVASVTLLPEPLDRAALLSEVPVLSHLTRPSLWEQFWQQFGLADSNPQYGAGFEHFFMALEGVKQQMGMALIPTFMASAALSNDQIVNPLGLSIDSGYGYYLYSARYKQRSPAVMHVINWLYDALNMDPARHPISKSV
ncbi:LysR family transcriptional regulator [Salinivibrio sp. ES.052]|uniref:LysR family transcriptional regulator n=1 Tax=Salinivibrio sp. ES.052 TaxID=1882823 RepID=UPI0015881394|nr:LysR substrate-binding domain-containing protein [Salinivibrio sp. ES.052]